jgi:putative membrane-bound dehydrogenase-like protein
MALRIEKLAWFAGLSLLVVVGNALAAEMPRVDSTRYRLELVAENPEIVTPIGMTFDRNGRLLVVESHTHKRTSEYVGPEGDRIRMFSDSDGDGRLDRWTTWADGLLHAMNILARPDGAVYVLARHQLLLLRDTDGDGRADERREIMHLETEDDYPHNGLGGIALQADGSLLVCLGENHGFAFRLTGSDGSSLAGTGGLDGVIHATADGGKLEWLAHGVWNPFAICVDPHGRMFAVDNDPDASPPCRLLHIAPGGDYGYLFQYGRAGTHPLQAWNGELPGTLPMVCGVGEAPTAIVAHAGSLWVTSWGDHRVERYRLVPRGASFGAEREIVVQGNADFRPTGMAVAPDGSLYFGDWRRRDYEVHNTGRIWRLTVPQDEIKTPFPSPSELELGSTDGAESSVAEALSEDPFVRARLVRRLSQRDPRDIVIGLKPLRLPLLQAERLRGIEDVMHRDALLRAALADESPDVRLFAVRWIADERIVALRDAVAKLLEGPLESPRYYLAVLGAVDWLDREPALRNSGINDALLVRELKNKSRSPAVHALALRLISPEDKFLTLDCLRGYLSSDNDALRREAVRTLAMKTDPARATLLAEVAADESQSDDMRADAIAGLAAFADSPASAMVLESFFENPNPALRREAERSLRTTGIRPPPEESKPAANDIAAWTKLLEQPGDAAAGRRIFFSAAGPRCSVCHRFDGRGGTIGPDLTHIGRVNSRERIVTSILQPSQEIAPHFQPWVLTTNDGKTRTGLRLAKGGDDGIEPYADAEGNVFTLPSETIDDRAASAVSIMPDGLEKTLSIADLRDLLTYLMNGEVER